MRWRCSLAAMILKPPWPQPSTFYRALWLLGEIDLPKEGPTTPEGVIMQDPRSEARQELAAKEEPAMSRLIDPFMEEELSARVADLAKSRLKKAMA
jgi:hypothetical protein